MKGRLIVGPLPSDFDPERDVPFAPWCLLNASIDGGLMEDWPWETNPYASRASKLAMADEVHDQVRFWAHRLGEGLDGGESGSTQRRDYWELVLAPWLIAFLTTLLDCSRRVNWLLERYPDHRWAVYQAPSTRSAKTKTTREFNQATKSGHLQIQFTREILDSRGVDYELHESGELEAAGDRDAASPEVRAKGWKSYLMRLSQYFERSGPVLSVRGFTPFDTFLFGACLQLTPSSQGSPEALPNPPEPNFGRTCPSRETMDRLLEEHLPSKVVDAAVKGGLDRGLLWRRYLVGNYINDDHFRTTVARAQLHGRDVIGVQHGWNTGLLAQEIKSPLLEYRLNRFVTWGFRPSSGQTAGFLPLPSPFLKLRHSVKKGARRIMIVGKQQALVPSVIDSRPVPEDIWKYRRNKLSFLSELSEETRAVTSYRPYEREKGCQEDGAYLQRHYPDLEIVRGPIGKEGLLGSDLLVFDRFGTVNLLALACNRPFVTFFRSEEYAWSKRGEAFLSGLEELGLLFPSPASAAQAVEQIWPRVGEWWSEPGRSEGVKQLRDDYAHYRPDWRRQWLRALVGRGRERIPESSRSSTSGERVRT